MDRKWIYGPLLVLGLNAPAFVPAGCASHDVTEDPAYVRALELAADGVSDLERPEFERLVGDLESDSAARQRADEGRLRGVKDALSPLTGPLEPLVDPLGELGLLAWFLVSERKNKAALAKLRELLPK